VGAKLRELFEADGITHRGWIFHCPACESKHQIDNRWGFDGNVSNPTIVGSVLQHAADHGTPEEPIHRPRCHSIITNGMIFYCDDCEHSMKGQTVELPDCTKSDHA
jgi:hypothetical protein